MDTELIDLLATASVISAAQQSGLLKALHSGPQTAQAYAEKLGLDARATRLELDALVAFDLASRDQDAYDASARLKDLMKGMFGQGSGGLVADLWSHTPTFLKTG